MLYADTENTLKGKRSPKSVYISVNNHMKLKKKLILFYTIWDGFSLKTIPRYCPLKGTDTGSGSTTLTDFGTYTGAS
jgi:hypothetical protein